MAVKIRRTYKGAAVAAVLDASGVTSATQTSITLSTSPSTWPTGKFFAVFAPGTAQEEKMCVTLSGATLTVVDPAVSSTSASANGRGVDNTTARSTIAGGSAVYPVFTAVDADEANELTSAFSAQGHMVYQGASTFTGLAIGTAGQVLKVNSGATAPEWGQTPTAGIADTAVTLAKLATVLQNALPPVGTIVTYAGAAAPTGWLICDGSTFNATTYASLNTVLGGNTLPDFRGKFAMGKTASSTGSTLLGTGGSNTIAEGNLPSHSHANTASASSTSTSTTTISDPQHSHSITVSGNGSHSHNYQVAGVLGSNVADTGYVYAGGTGETFTTDAATHSHTGSSNSVSTGITASTSTTTTTTVTMTNANTGSGTAYFQPFVAVNYIIKHDYV